MVPLESKIYHSTRLLRVLVPANYFSPHNRTRSYPVLYMQDGQNLFDAATSRSGEWHLDETVEHLVGGLKIPPMFVVGIDNGGATRKASYRISGAGITTTTINGTDSGGVNFNGAFKQANSTPGNYVKFTINATGFNLTATPGSATDGVQRAAINGIQIVPN